MRLIEVLNNLKQKALGENRKGIEIVLEASNTNKERIFPILNKLDRLWTIHSTLQFCELIKMINTDEYKSDLLLTKRLDELIDGTNTD